MINIWTILFARTAGRHKVRSQGIEPRKGQAERGYEGSRFRDRYEDRSERDRDGRGKDLRLRHE